MIAVIKESESMAAEANCYESLDIHHLRSLDPLDADQILAALPEINSRKDLPALVAALQRIAPDREKLARFSLSECLAAMRDIGMFLGSIKRLGTEPLDAMPEIEPILLELGRRSDMAPRDTIHHYVSWNPEGPRERTYTGNTMEKTLISSVRMVLPRLGHAVGSCAQLAGQSLVHPEFPFMVEELLGAVGVMESSIDRVLQHVSPEFFARGLRPYFEDIRVGGRRFLGPAAAHVPIALIDLVLWASDHVDPGYEEFWREAAEFGLPAWRPLYPKFRELPSLVTRLKDALGRVSGEIPEALRASAEAIALTLRALVVFRGKHLRIARRAYAEDVRLYELGSGGGSIALLNDVLALTRENGALLCRSFNPPKTGCDV